MFHEIYSNTKGEIIMDWFGTFFYIGTIFTGILMLWIALNWDEIINE